LSTEGWFLWIHWTGPCLCSQSFWFFDGLVLTIRNAVHSCKHQRSHFKDNVIQEINEILQIKHHMTTAYSSRANGTVEKVNNDIQRLFTIFDFWVDTRVFSMASSYSTSAVGSESLVVPFSCRICFVDNHDRIACSLPFHSCFWGRRESICHFTLDRW
jgi:hypothetical protein